MDCLEFSRMLDNYAGLSEDQLAEMRAHAALCDKCKGELDFFESMMNTVASLPEVEPPADFLKLVNERIDSTETVQRFTAKGIFSDVRLNIKRYSTIAACLVVGVIVGLNSDFIADRLNGGNDGVIDERTVTTDSTELPGDNGTDDAVMTVDSTPMPSPEISESSDQTAAPIQTDSIKNRTDSTPVRKNPTAGTNINGFNTQAATNAPTVKAPGINKTENTAATAQVTSTPAASQISESEPVSDANAEAVVDPVVEIQADLPDQTPEPVIREQYTIAHKYYLPDDYEEPDIKPTEQASVESYSISGDKYQIAYGYELPEEEQKPVTRNMIVHQVIIDSSVAQDVVSVLLNFNVESTGSGYTASADEFYAFLAALDAQNIEYTYTPGGDDGGTVSFRIILM